MSRRFKATIRNRRRNVRRRGCSSRPDEQKLCYVSIGIPGSGYPTTVQEISPADREDMENYIQSHCLLPRHYNYDPANEQHRRSVSEAVATVRNPSCHIDDLRDVMAAIVLLGHSPTPEAVAALEEISSSSHPFCDLARMALDECLTLAARESLSRDVPQPASAMN